MREYDRKLDGKAAVRSGNATIRQCLEEAARAVRNNDWYSAEQAYGEIVAWASSLRESAEINDCREMDKALFISQFPEEMTEDTNS